MSPKIDIQTRFYPFVPTDGFFKDVTISVDVTECPLSKPKDWEMQKYLFSTKKQRCTYKYEVVTHSATGRILRVAGGIPKRHDLTIMRLFGLLKELEPWERGIADKGYQGAPDRIMTPFKRSRDEKHTPYMKYWDKCISSVRATTERTNGVLKYFAVLSTEWRGELETHAVVFNVVAQLTNIKLRYHPIVEVYNPLLRR
jgi:hypothetical protein